jgi:hypothetical protein
MNIDLESSHILVDLFKFVPLVIGLTKVLKMSKIPSRFIPLSTLAISIAIAYYVQLQYPVLVGLVMGLMSMGLYSGTKKTAGR